jgi:DNA mismatch endonuclease (patch repair protein)
MTSTANPLERPDGADRPPPASSEAVRAVMKGNRGSDTKPEVALRSLLHSRGLRFRKNWPPVQGLRCRADIAFVSARLAIFVDGCFWHSCPEHGSVPKTNRDYWLAKLSRNVRRDRASESSLEANGWRVMRIWEHETATAAADRIAAEVLRRSA